MNPLHLLTLIVLLFLATSCCSTITTIHFRLTSKDSAEYSIPRRHLPAVTPTSQSSVGVFLAHPLWAGASISFATGFVLGTLAFLLWTLIFKRYYKADPIEEFRTNPTIFNPIIQSTQDLLFLYGEECLSLEIIGRGGCGEVYKAEVVSGGRTIPVAIKKILQPSVMDASQLCEEESKLLDNRVRQIRSEIMTVGRMRHPHLVRLLAHVPKPDSHYLVYQFMTNGSLHDVLKSNAREKLNWPSRLKIAQGIASGLEYLHMVHRPRIIHRDLKPANILLDDELNARIADFGLAKVVPDVISRAMSSANVAGTLGYIAPEYYQTMSCTDKCDIYSFGVILAVLVTGMFPTDGFFQMTDDMCLMAWVRRVVSSDDPSEAIDPMLLETGFETVILLILKIACFCTFDDPNERPNSREVNHMLSQIKH